MTYRRYQKLLKTVSRMMEHENVEDKRTFLRLIAKIERYEKKFYYRYFGGNLR